MEVTKYKKLTRILVFVLIIVMVGMFFMSWGGGDVSVGDGDCNKNDM